METKALEIFLALNEKELSYIINDKREEYFGFSALHDLCDANMLLPEDETISKCNDIISEFNTLCDIEKESRDFCLANK